MWPNGSVKKNVLDGLMMMMDSNETWHFIFLSPPPSIRKKKGNQGPFCSEMKCQVAPPPTPPCEVGAGGDAGRVGGRRGRIGPTLMRHAYLDMFKRYGQQDANEILFSYFFSRKKETRPSFYFSRGQRTDGREKEKTKIHPAGTK